jgi:predicted ATPase
LVRVVEAEREGRNAVACGELHDPAVCGLIEAGVAGRIAGPDRTLLDALVAFSKNPQLLLVLANCEHVVAERARS